MIMYYNTLHTFMDLDILFTNISNKTHSRYVYVDIKHMRKKESGY